MLCFINDHFQVTSFRNKSGNDWSIPNLNNHARGLEFTRKELRISEAPFEEPEIPVSKALKIPYPRSFDMKKIFFETKK
jgi:hypothetical protein